MGYKGHKSEWGRDTGCCPGHPTKHPQMNAPGQAHTSFQSRGFHEDRGSNTHPERMHMHFSNRVKHDADRAPTNVEGGHDPNPEYFHKNSGTESAGDALVRRRGSVIHGMNRGYK